MKLKNQTPSVRFAMKLLRRQKKQEKLLEKLLKMSLQETQQRLRHTKFHDVNKHGPLGRKGQGRIGRVQQRGPSQVLSTADENDGKIADGPNGSGSQSSACPDLRMDGAISDGSENPDDCDEQMADQDSHTVADGLSGAEDSDHRAHVESSAQEFIVGAGLPGEEMDPEGSDKEAAAEGAEEEAGVEDAGQEPKAESFMEVDDEGPDEAVSEGAEEEAVAEDAGEEEEDAEGTDEVVAPGAIEGARMEVDAQGLEELDAEGSDEEVDAEGSVVARSPPNSQEVIVISDNEDSDEDSDDEDTNGKQPENEDTTVQRTARPSGTTRTRPTITEFPIDYYTSPKRRRESKKILDAEWKSAMEKFQNAQDVAENSFVEIERVVLEKHEKYKLGQPYQGLGALKELHSHMDVIKNYIESVVNVFNDLEEKEADQQYYMADGDENDKDYKPPKAGRNSRGKQ
ncbi:hypothetical protein BU23DRAFT_210867 [Bimuria novae-zelandiae CBS 107.79]|uniref:Uncharacterized protein n=1 Tax=Bimuria novae-zelandiae CBS 107.79 TaxID=1447943 RepID=A0A6A5V3G4_9PLEO|nr:hypothetical protein BU23DRAFT_210867 [Bimuria novae-zelandiae CBS 107.79]